MHDSIDPDGRIRFNGHDALGAEMAETILRRLRYPNQVIDDVVAMVGRHMQFMNVQKMRVAKLKRFMAEPTFEREMELHRVDCASSNGFTDNYEFLQAKSRRIRRRAADPAAARHRPGPHQARPSHARPALQGNPRSHPDRAARRALENVELPLLYRGYTRKQRHQLAREALASVGLPDKERNTPAELSGGQQQRVAIARAIVTSPDTLFADEPTGNLDSKTTHEIMELLRHLNTDRGISIIMVTHEKDVAVYAKRHIHVLDGLIAQGIVDRRS
jgi:ABC-type dipeptide/oligopeptide/nickel transport system ATPase subunit